MTTKSIITNFLFLVFLASCASPEKSFQKGQYTKAMRLATKEIQKGKNVAQNKKYLASSASILSEQTLSNYLLSNSTDIKDWKDSQNEFNSVLATIGKNNIATKGLVSDSYNKLCDVKYDLDLRIVDYYYQNGLDLLTESKSTGTTELAREAYHQFVKSEKEGANTFYTDLEVLKEECIEYGSIYVSAPSELQLKSLFLRTASVNEEQRPDCYITVSYGHVNIDESKSINTTTLKERVKVGQNAITDTSGVTRYEDLFEEVTAKEHRTVINYTAHQTLDIRVKANTDECFLRSRTVRLAENDTCTEVSYTGDMRAVKSNNSTNCNDSQFRSNLRRAIERALDSELYIR